MPGAASWARAGSAVPAASAHELFVAAAVPLAELEALGIEPAQIRTLLERGLANQAGLHLYDDAAAYDLSLPTLVADMLGAADQRELGELGLLYELGFFAGMLSSPAYVAVPVKDAQVVDNFLAQLDAGLARRVPTWRDHLFGTNLQGEFYHLARKSGVAIRALGVRAGPARYRLFWARIGDGLAIAGLLGILDDLQTASAQKSPTAASDRGLAGHAALKLASGRLVAGRTRW